jgi:hypothetical protein
LPVQLIFVIKIILYQSKNICSLLLNEFINLVSEYDLNNLRSYFSSTDEKKFEEIKKGLINRIEKRRAAALGGGTRSEQTPIPPQLGQTISSASTQNTDARRQAGTGSNVQIQQNNRTTVVNQRTVAGPPVPQPNNNPGLRQ